MYYKSDGVLMTTQTVQDMDGNDIQIPKRVFGGNDDEIEIATLKERTQAKLDDILEMESAFNDEKTLAQVKVELEALTVAQPLEEKL